MATSEQAGRFSDGQAARTYALAGNARLTLVSQKTSARFTYRIARGKWDGAPHFVSVLQGSDNEADYGNLGTIFPPRSAFFHGKRSRISREAPSARAFVWAWAIIARGELPPGCEVFHEGTCGRCGRALTVPESIASGFGPVCSGREAA